jgi:hypothetical protein
LDVEFVVPHGSRWKSSTVTNIKSDSLEELLRDRPADEKQGANASLGFGFQQWWAALAVVELLATQDDFAVGIEVKEDIALLDSPTVPTKVEFCQIKKNEQDGAWTFKELYNKGKKLKSGGYETSILAKLYKRRHEFLEHSTKLRFVSNVGVKVPAEDGSTANSHDTRIEDLTETQQTVVKKAIASQLGVDESLVTLKNMLLHKTNLPLGEPEAFVGGKLSQLCENSYLPFPIPQPTVAARVLASELQSKASSTNYARSLSDLRRRLMSRSDALNTLAKLATVKPNISTVLNEAIERLNAEGHDFLTVKSIKGESIRVCVDAVDRTNLLFRDLAKLMFDVYDEIVGSAAHGTKLGELMERLVQFAQQKNPAEFSGRSAGYINAIALLVLNDGIDINVCTAKTDSKFEATQ